MISIKAAEIKKSIVITLILTIIILLVLESLSSISFYQKMGFVTSVEVGKSVTMVKRL